jgi:trans-aconitate 2-methyltransferase
MASTAQAPKWDPQQYKRFAAERARPFDDLLAVVEGASMGDIADLGCGPGGLTAQLWERWPTARVLGLDNSPEMLADAAKYALPGRIEFELADVRSWEPARRFDLIVSNATLQWVPGHLGLFARLAGYLKPGGTLAVQVPGNFAEPTHVLLRALASSPEWHPHLAGAGKIGEGPASHDPADYLAEMLRLGLEATAWETTYHQVLQGPDAVLDWIRGTALRPILTALDPPQAAEFEEEYRQLLREAYPETPAGTVLPYRRVFAVGRRPLGAGEGAPEAVVLGADHTQLAMPTGEEAAARAFYGEVLGMVEIAKPPVLAARGGCWFKAHGTEVHLGVEAAFRPAEKAHVALVVSDLDAYAARLAAAGFPVKVDDELLPRRRFFTADPFGNRVEIMAVAA